MIVRNRPVVVYDIEVFPNCFHCTCNDTEGKSIYKFEISNRKNQLSELVDYFYFHRTEHVICGYNNHHYDDIIINYIIHFKDKMEKVGYRESCRSIYQLSSCIVNSDEELERYKKWKYANYFYSFDLMTMLFSAKRQKSLKELQIILRYPNVQEYDGRFDQWLPDDKIDDMIEYNENDVDSTVFLLNKVKGEIDLRLLVEKEWGFDALSMSGVRFGEEILYREFCKVSESKPDDLRNATKVDNTIPLKDVILPFIKYSNPKLKEVLLDAMKVTCYAKKSDKKQQNYEKKFVLSNTCYSIGEGGIHTINEPRIFKPKNGQYIGHADVTSMYPSLALIYNWLPRHLGKEFWNVYNSLYEERITAKRNGEKLKNAAFKRALNALTGKMQQETSWAYDPLNVYKIRINGQLILLMLVERLLNLNCEIVQVNTDGVVYVANEDCRDSVNAAIKDIEHITKLSFDTDDYESFYQCDVNNYFGVCKGYSQSRDPKLIEKKGMFITDLGIDNSMTPVVIPKAVIEHFLTGVSVSDYIRNDKDIQDFVIAQGVSKDFKVEYAGKYIQRINRYYASIDGYYLFKVKDNSYESIKRANMLTESGVTILNKIDDTPINKRWINYGYYISKAKKIAHSLGCQQLSLFN